MGFWSKYKIYIIPGGVMFIGYTLVNSYLSSAIGSVTGQYTAAAVASLLAVTSFWVSKKVEKQV